MRVRWYVEGNTEAGAISLGLEVERATYVQVINLQGHVAEKRTLAFRDSLRNDKRAGIFSMVSLDSDRSDFAKVVRRAVEEDEPCGLVQYSEPDFESANFDRRELADLIWEIVSGSVPAGRRSEVEAAVMEAPANRILDAVRTVAPEITLKKGAEWGRLLMRYALAHPLQRVTGVRRPILDALEAAVNANTASFHSTRSRFRLDPATGRLEPRPGAQPADPPAEN